MRILLLLLLSGIATAQAPEAPEPQPKPVHVYTFRKSWQDPPLRTNRRTFTSKYFIVAEGISFAAMAVACSRKGTGEHWDSEAPAWGAQFGLGYLTDRYMDELYTLGIAGYMTGHYIHSSIK